jgi:hypothetical protein
MVTATDSRSSRACPWCGGALKRVPRLAEDRIASFSTPMRRYRCSGETCGWEGLLAAPRSRRAAAAGGRCAHGAGRAAWARPVPLFFIALFTAAVGVQAARMYRAAMPDPVLAKLSAGPVVPFGQSHEGAPLSPDHPLLAQTAASSDAGAAPAETVGPIAQPARPATAPAAATQAADAQLALRQDCAWGDPGRDPYRGTVEEALKRAKLPPEVVREIARKVQAGEANDRLEITNQSIRAVHDAREFDSKRVAMTFGRTLCVNTRVNFQPGHVERADLFEASDSLGNSYSVMVPYVCGNVSVLGERAERDDDEAPTIVLGADGQPVMKKGDRVLPAALIGTKTTTTLRGTDGGGGGGTTRSAQVPEPGTWASLLTGLAVMGWFVRRRKR